MIALVLLVFLFVTILTVGLAVDHARSAARNVEPAWTVILPRKRTVDERANTRGSGVKTLRTLLQSMRRWPTRRDRVFIFGAGEAGASLASTLDTRRDIELVGFLDDDLELRSSTVNGVKVFVAQSLPELVRRHRVSRVLLALPSSATHRRARIIKDLGDLSVHVQSIPGTAELSAGTARIDDLRELDITDILGRDQLAAELDTRGKSVARQSVMVTGAGGSVGVELCLQIARLGATRLVLFDISEQALYEVDRQIRRLVSKESINIEVIPLLGSVRDQNRLEEVLKAYAVNTVYHAAAYKHVPLIEYNMIEGVANNVLGTLHVAKAAIAANVKYFIFVSTDKAVYPTNVVGASKRLAEQVIQSLNERGTKTKFAMVRFGNVLGSSGSVVPLFHEQIRRGGPVTVTHKDIVRYFMTITEAAGLVLQAAALAEGGEVFVLDMGEPVRIAELAEKMIRMSGFTVQDNNNPGGDIEIVYTGLRPAEKLYEELLIGTDVKSTKHRKIMVVLEEFTDWDILNPLLSDLAQACDRLDRDKIRELLVKAVPEYSPTNSVEDLVWRQLIDPDRLEGLGSDHIYQTDEGKPAGLAEVIEIKKFQTAR